MAEFDDKLNSLLSNPEAMDQIMKMAQSLMGNGGGTEQPPHAAPPSLLSVLFCLFEINRTHNAGIADVDQYHCTQA